MSASNVVPLTPGAGPLIKPRERDSIIQALRTGVVPRLGLPHIQVGRVLEVDEILRDIDRIGQGGSAARFIIGDYGSGKSFLLKLARLVALQRKVVVVHVDLTPERRLHANQGQARLLYAELMRNMATRTKPEGGALSSILERFITEAERAAEVAQRPVAEVIGELLAPIQDLVSGYDFANVIIAYQKSYEAGDEPGKSDALRWLLGEYAKKSEVPRSLGVRSIIDDHTVYDFIRVMGCFVRIAGYGGFLVVLDEMVNLYKIPHRLSRDLNYEQVLRIVNDVLQGSTEGLGFLFGGTPEFLMDGRRGLYSYGALKSRLQENSFAKDGLVDMSGPIIRLQSLSREELFVLLGNLRHVFAGGDPERYLVPDEAFTAFMAHCEEKVGEAYFRTPRTTIKAFLDLLAILEQNPGTDWQTLLPKVELEADTQGDDASEGEVEGANGQAGAAAGASADANELASFRL